MKISVLATCSLSVACVLATYSLSASAADYTEALNRAREAAMIQTGVQRHIDAVKDYGTKTGWYYLKVVGVEKEVGAGIYLYKIYRDKSVSLRVGRNERVTLRLDSATLTIQF